MNVHVACEGCQREKVANAKSTAHVCSRTAPMRPLLLLPPPTSARLSSPMMTAAATGLLILVRHGTSTWNDSNRFTGWADVPLTEGGLRDAEHAAQLLIESRLEIDVAYTSMLQRARDTTISIVEELQSKRPSRRIPRQETWRLNERHYGALTGLSKSEAARSLDRADLRAWRSTLDGRPPPMEADHPYYTPNDPLYTGMEVPLTESLRDCCARVQPFWDRSAHTEPQSNPADPLVRVAGRQWLTAHSPVGRSAAARAAAQRADGSCRRARQLPARADQACAR